jgi:hypothetical protein
MRGWPTEAATVSGAPPCLALLASSEATATSAADIAPSFSTANVPGLPDGHWRGSASDYTTAVVGNKSIEWIREKAKAGTPWLAYVAPKACHEPFNPAPW